MRFCPLAVTTLKGKNLTGQKIYNLKSKRVFKVLVPAKTQLLQEILFLRWSEKEANERL